MQKNVFKSSKIEYKIVESKVLSLLFGKQRVLSSGHT